MTSCHILVNVLIILCVSIVSCNLRYDYDNFNDNIQGSRLHLDLLNLQSGYHGLVRENETKVEVTPRIRAVGGRVCSFKITNKHHGEAPFGVLLIDREKGLAELRSKKPLNCEKRKNYKFDIVAEGCDEDTSESATVHITVLDVNEYAPEFDQPAYVVQVEEGKVYGEITRVTATDQDCSPEFGDICKYEITTADQPFTIDNEGSIQNTSPLDYTASKNHILSVVAYDCGMRRSHPVMVTIKVNRVCHLGWKGIANHIEYSPGSGSMELFPDSGLDLCDVPCDVASVETKINLATHHIGKGCDRDTYSVESQRKLCGANKDSVDLLPSASQGSEWTAALPTDSGHEADEIFAFDGKTHAAIVPAPVLNHNLSHTFTIATWMRHKQNLEFDKHRKEHIFCNADDHKMNRHHYGLFVRNCRLVLLLRRDFTEGNLNTFKPAEWRWKLPQVCDDMWHHYAVNVQFPNVDLYVDGRLVHAQQNNPDIIDDWPLHPTQGINTTLSVGACWHGSKGEFKFHFAGYLAGLSILLHETEKPEVLSCLHRCQESLETPPRELLQPGMELLANNDLTDVTIEGDNKTNMNALFKRLAYTNSREFPTAGRRDIKISTSIVCESGKTLKVPSVSSYVLVLQPTQPSIEVNGTQNVAYHYDKFREGVKVFSDVRINVATNTEEKNQWKNGEPRSAVEHKLDSCSVSVFPALNPDHETLTLPLNLLTTLAITYSLQKEGVHLTGADFVYNYEQVLRQIHYTNRKPAYYLNRAFKLTCGELNGRFVSNEYQQTLTVIHPQSHHTEPVKPVKKPVKKVSSGGSIHNLQVDTQHVQQNLISPQLNGAESAYLTPQMLESASGASHAVTIIVVVCVGFLLFMIVLGVIRIRAAHHRSHNNEAGDQEMAWDDSGLNITVNPMEAQIARQERSALNPESDSDSSDDEGASLYEESSEDECPVGRVQDNKHRDLEWDNSTLSI